MEFNIGDKVYHKLKKGIGVIEDKLTSTSGVSTNMYVVQLGDGAQPCLCREDQLEPISKSAYSIEVERADSVIIAVLYENCPDGKRELRRGHGHILHNSEVGFAQAASYAMRRIYLDLNGGNIRLDEVSYE